MKKFRAIPDGWAHFTYGGSTGGWESLAVQIFYPDHYNGVFCACPDPVDFRAYTLIDLYKDPNAFLPGRRAQARGATGHAQLSRPYPHHHQGRQRLRACAGRPRPLRRAVGHLAGGLRAGRSRWLSAAHLQQGDRRDRPQGRRLLEGALRPARHPGEELGDARAQAARQDSHLRAAAPIPTS